MFSDIDIKNRINKDFAILPFDEANINPIGYDLSIGKIIFSKKNGLIKETEDGIYIIKPNDTIHILTNELIWLSGRISGTLHSRTSLSYKGLSNISTTIDPNWTGQLLLTFTNLTSNKISINKNKPICTLNLYRVDTETSLQRHHINYIKSYITKEIKNHNDNYLFKVKDLIDQDEYKLLKSSLQESSLKNISLLRPIISMSRLRSLGYKALTYTYCILLILALIAIICSIVRWDFFSPYFQNIKYDSVIFGTQISSIIIILIHVASLKK